MYKINSHRIQGWSHATYITGYVTCQVYVLVLMWVLITLPCVSLHDVSQFAH